MKKMLILGLLLVILSTASFAAPTFYGPTGLIKSPSADSLAAGEFDLALHNYNKTNILTFNLGLAKGFEAGISARNSNNSNSTRGFLKYTIVPERSGQIGIAVGAKARSNDTSFFVVGSKYLPEIGVRGHLGMETVGNGTFFVSASKTLPSKQAFPKMIAMGEFYGGELNLGLRMLLTRDVNLDLCLMDLSGAMIGLGFHSSF
jgi:hypothetical protein